MPATLLIIFVLLYLTFARFGEALLTMVTLPFPLTVGAWFLYLLGFNLSDATGVGFIALAGVSAEFGVIMLLCLKNAWAEREDLGDSTERGLVAAIREGAVQRVRPKAMTVAVIIAGLLPILLGSGYRKRSNEPHCSAYGRRHGHGTLTFSVCHPGSLLPYAS